MAPSCEAEGQSSKQCATEAASTIVLTRRALALPHACLRVRDQNRTTKPGVWSRDMHKFYVRGSRTTHTRAATPHQICAHTEQKRYSLHNDTKNPKQAHMRTPQSDLWDPEADPEALNERGFGIGQWRLQEHFKNRHDYAQRMVCMREQLILLSTKLDGHILLKSFRLSVLLCTTCA